MDTKTIAGEIHELLQKTMIIEDGLKNDLRHETRAHFETKRTLDAEHVTASCQMGFSDNLKHQVKDLKSDLLKETKAHAATKALLDVRDNELITERKININLSQTIVRDTVGALKAEEDDHQVTMNHLTVVLKHYQEAQDCISFMQTESVELCKQKQLLEEQLKTIKNMFK